jgi:hypothetical protein
MFKIGDHVILNSSYILDNRTSLYNNFYQWALNNFNKEFEILSIERIFDEKYYKIDEINVLTGENWRIEKTCLLSSVSIKVKKLLEEVCSE